MNNFNVEGDLGRHHLFISCASTQCGISISTIHREQGKTFTNKASITSDLIKFGTDYKSWLIDRSTGMITQDSFKGKWKKTKILF